MEKGKKKVWIIPTAAVFIIYIFAAARPVPEETVLKPRWLSSLDTEVPVKFEDYSRQDAASQEIYTPFSIGNRFGYVDDTGAFILNKELKGYLSISDNFWTTYTGTPVSIEIKTPADETLTVIENPGGYPFILDNKIYIVSEEQNTLKSLDNSGRLLWAYDFPSPITCIDAAAGYTLVGALDGTIDILDSTGRTVLVSFEPGGSRIPVITGCAISRSGTYIALISGIDDQRFILLERTSENYKIIYHEFLGDGFRRPTYIGFVNNDSYIIFEREGGIGIYSLESRLVNNVSVQGRVISLDDPSAAENVFLITSEGPVKKRLVAVKLPGEKTMEAPFTSKNVFWKRRGSKVYIGGDKAVISFELGKN